MSGLEVIITEAVKQNNVDLMLPEILKTKFFMVCYRENETADPEIFMAPSLSPDQLCITVSEDPALLESIEEENEKIVLAEIDGDQLLGIVAEEHEIVIVFSEGSYCIPRDHIEWWYAEEPEVAQE